METKIFDKYYKRIAQEGILKATIIGLIAGGAVAIAIAFITLFFSGFTLWFLVALGAGIIVGMVTALLLYYKAFRPTTKSIARRIDSLGLEERLITMTELENDESYIAMRQREDAQAKLSEVDRKSIKFVIAKSLMGAAIIVGIIAISMTTINALTGFGIIDWSKLFPAKHQASDFITATYLVSGNGEIEGISIQENILKGTDATTVIAVSDRGWAFVGWSDGVRLPERTDTDLKTDLTVTAIFEEVEGFGFGDEQEDEPTDLPQEEGDQSGNGENSSEPSNSASGGRYEPANTIIDGEISYIDDFDDWYEKAIQELMEDGNILPERQTMLEKYYEALKGLAGSK